MTFDQKFKRVKPVLVGLWRFRSVKRGLEWCATWTHRGVYYDMFPKDTPEKALDAVYHAWNRKKRVERQRRNENA